MADPVVPILKVQGLSKSFRGLQALQDVNLTLNPGEIRGVIGPNGAGKTTFFNCLTGYLVPTSGKILFHDRDITGMQSPAVARLGMARTFQNIRLFGALTVLDNVLVAQQLRTHFNLLEVMTGLGGFQRKERALVEAARAHLDLFGLTDDADRQVMNLPYGAQRRLEMARALATGPEVLLLDEPAAGMNANETDNLHQLILQVRERFKVSVILVEHDMRLVMNLCERITVLNYGRALAEGTPDDIRQNQTVIESYLGKAKQPKQPAVAVKAQRMTIELDYHGLPTDPYIRSLEGRLADIAGKWADTYKDLAIQKQFTQEYRSIVETLYELGWDIEIDYASQLPEEFMPEEYLRRNPPIPRREQ